MSVRERRWIQKGYWIFLLLHFLSVWEAFRHMQKNRYRTQGKSPAGYYLSVPIPYAWETVPEQIRGIKEALGAGVQLDYQFMDTKNVETAESEQLFYQTLTYYLKMVPAYDVVIVGDDAAFQFAMTYRDELFAQTPVVFEGVNDGELAEEGGSRPACDGRG